MDIVERWGIFEVRLEGTKRGNPFVECWISGEFESEYEHKKVSGFYDGDGIYLIRFMPSFTGEYQYRIYGNFSDNEYNGKFSVISNSGNNHGPVHVAAQYHFSYEDGKPYYQIGTTCYAWLHQKDEMQRKTLDTLKEGYFNKIRFCIFPKHYDYNLYEPETYPYIGTPCSIVGITKENFNTYSPSNPENRWDFNRFNPIHFQNIEKQIQSLQELGIEADIILFHPYDRWGFSQMSMEENLLYLSYVVARLSAYRNVWWSLANEYDLCTAKSMQDWEQIADHIVKEDPYHRLRSIHNCKSLYDFTRPWVTHCSIQRNEIIVSAANTKRWREQYGKPVVLDEVGYEGDLNYFWGNLTAEEMVRLFWVAAVRGGYCGHGETYRNDQNELWWSHGGKLFGESARRLKFLHQILEEVPGLGLRPANLPQWEDNAATAEHSAYEGRYYLCYTDRYRPGFREFYFDDTTEFSVDVIDTWQMTIEYKGTYNGKFQIDLPGRPYILVRINKK